MPSLTDFIAPMKGESATVRALGMIYYTANEEAVDGVTSTVLRELFTRVRARDAKTINPSDILSRLGESGYLEAIPRTRPISWKITDSGETKVREVLGIEADSGEMRAEIAELTLLARKIKSEETRDFLLEAVSCLGAMALRATIVFVWSGAIWTVQEWLMKKPLDKVNAEIQKQNPKSREIKRIEDFAFINDETILIAARELKLWDKGQHTMVKQALELRNQCGHPSRYNVPPSRCKSVIEELITLVFNHAV